MRKQLLNVCFYNIKIWLRSFLIYKKIKTNKLSKFFLMSFNSTKHFTQNHIPFLSRMVYHALFPQQFYWYNRIWSHPFIEPYWIKLPDLWAVIFFPCLKQEEEGKEVKTEQILIILQSYNSCTLCFRSLNGKERCQGILLTLK